MFLFACGGETRVAPDRGALTSATAARTAGVVLGPVAMLESPAAEGSAEPFLATDSEGSLLLSWLQRSAADAPASLRFSRLSQGKWTPPQTIVERGDLFVNWADFPSVTVAPDGSLVAHWLQKSGTGSYAYDVRLARSADGAEWSPSVVPHDDGTKTEHGFVSAHSHPDGKRIALTWLDGRHTGGGGHDSGGAMTLRYAAVDPATLQLSDETQLDDRVCDCCQTSMAIAEAGPVIVYRDRSPKEIRDISIVRWSGSGWTAPASVHDDGWEINGCPVNGPQIASSGNRLVVAWFTAANNEQRVHVAFSGDGGATFGPPTRIDQGKPLGRVDVVMHSSGAAVVTWMEESGAAADILARLVTADGGATEPVVVARTATARNSGFPRMAADGQNVYFSWTEPGAPSRVRLASAVIREERGK